jgi:predicted transcriptional regulator
LKEVLPEKPVEEIQMKVERLRKFILEGWKGSLKTEEQLKRLDEAILLRLEKKIGKKEFQRLLDLPLKKGGVGLDRRTARNFARKLEVALISE